MTHKNIHLLYKITFAAIITLFVMTVTDNLYWNRAFLNSDCVESERIFRSEVERTRYESGGYNTGIGSTVCTKYTYYLDLNATMLFILGTMLIASGWTISEFYLTKS